MLTSFQFYNDSIPKIPTACITVEDAELMSRMAERGMCIAQQKVHNLLVK